MSGISAIYFLDRKGKPIIFRNYRGEVVQDVSECFQKQVLELEESNMKPAFTIEDVHYCWKKHQNTYSIIDNNLSCGSGQEECEFSIGFFFSI